MIKLFSTKVFENRDEGYNLIFAYNLSRIHVIEYFEPY